MAATGCRGCQSKAGQEASASPYGAGQVLVDCAGEGAGGTDGPYGGAEQCRGSGIHVPNLSTSRPQLAANG